MLKMLLICLAITSPVFADTTLNQSKVSFGNGDIDQSTFDSFYKLAVEEYNYSDFGFARDIFQAITTRTNKIGGCYFYLGKIYENVAQFKDLTLAKHFYLDAAKSNHLDINSRQQSYLALIRLTDDAKLAIKYAKSSTAIAESNVSKQCLILAYQKQYDQTGDEASLEKSEIVSQALDTQYFPAVDTSVQQVNLVKP